MRYESATAGIRNKMTRQEWYSSVSVIPLLPGSKKPAVQWKRYQDERATPEIRKAWYAAKPKYGWGMACGPVSGYVVLDFDGIEGESLLKQYELDIDDDDYPPRVKTANGVHLYYSCPEPEFLEMLKNWVSPTPGLDVRTQGGYVVIPPTVHPEKKVPYEFVVPPWTRKAPPLPMWFWDIVEQNMGSRAPAQKKEPQSGPEWKRWLAEDCPQGLPGGRHGRAATLAGVLLQKFKPPEALAMLQSWNGAHCKPPLSEAEVAKLVKDFAPSHKATDPAPPKKKRIKVMSAEDLHNSTMPERELVIDPFFADQDHVFIAGEGGMGKSVLALAMAYSISTGEPFLFFPVKSRRSVCYVDVENGEVRQRARQAKLIATHGIVPKGLTWIFAPEGLDLDSDEGLDTLYTLTAGIRVLILDPFLCFYPRLANENSNTEVRRVLNRLGYWAEDAGKNIIMVDHSPSLNAEAIKKGVQPKPRGAGAKQNWATVVMTLEGGMQKKILRWGKCRDIKPPEPMELTFNGPMFDFTYPTFSQEGE